MNLDNSNVVFELVENQFSNKYKYFGKLYCSSNGIGINIDYPKEKTKEAFYKMLKSESKCNAAACLGSLFYNLKTLGEDSFIEIYGEITDVINSDSFLLFINKWFAADGAMFVEPYFFDGMFGRFSSYGDMGYPDNEGIETKHLNWDEQGVVIKLTENGALDDIKGNIYIDIKVESEFENELMGAIELFKL